MRTAGDSLAPFSNVDDGWRDLVTSAPMPTPPLPPQAERSMRISVPADITTTDSHGCVTNVQLGHEVEVMNDRPSFDASDRRMWRVAGALMGLATLVLLLLGVLTFRSEP